MVIEIFPGDVYVYGLWGGMVDGRLVYRVEWWNGRGAWGGGIRIGIGNRRLRREGEKIAGTIIYYNRLCRGRSRKYYIGLHNMSWMKYIAHLLE